MKTSARQKITLALDKDVYFLLKNKVGARGVGAYISRAMRDMLREPSIEEGYKAMAEYEKKHPDAELEDWLEAPLDDHLPDKFY